MEYSAQAHDFIEALKAIANDNYTADNLESYLSRHFGAWLQYYASTPDGITEELKRFATITNQ